MLIGVKLECGRNYLREMQWANKWKGRKKEKKEKESMASEGELQSQLMRSGLEKYNDPMKSRSWSFVDLKDCSRN